MKKLTEIYNNILEKSFEKETLETLHQNNKNTWPKIPVNKIFKNNVKQITAEERKSGDDLFSDDKYRELPKKFIPIEKIIPTQNNVTINNLKNVPDDKDTGAFLLKHNGNYFVLDGHHRVARRILQGDSKILCHVQE
jgi:hypothetical protein